MMMMTMYILMKCMSRKLKLPWLASRQGLFVCLFVTFYFHFLECWVCLFVCHILSLLSRVVRPLGRASEAWGEKLKKPRCIHVSQMYPNLSTQTALRPSDDNDDDSSNDDRVGAVVEQFGRTEEQIYWLISALLPVHLELHILSKTKTKTETSTKTKKKTKIKTEKPVKWLISVVADPELQIDL